jgi:2,3-bisphosphoglycerate-dependent phosphoglycerate mutase
VCKCPPVARVYGRAPLEAKHAIHISLLGMKSRSDPPGDPINVYFREALLIGGEATRLYLVRHAQSQGNTGEDLASGDADLTDVGREQARRLGERLKTQKISRVYASPLRRTQQTAAAIADATGLEVIPKADLREVELGQADHDIRKLPDKERAKVARLIMSQGTWDAFPGSEGSDVARNRVRGVIREIVNDHPGERLVVVAHAAFIQTFVSVVLGLQRDFIFYPFNASITSIRAKDGRFVLWRMNDIAHLDGMPAGFGGIS